MLIVWNCAHCGASQFEQKPDEVALAPVGIDSEVKHCTCCRERHIHNGAPLLLLESDRKRWWRAR